MWRQTRRPTSNADACTRTTPPPPLNLFCQNNHLFYKGYLICIVCSAPKNDYLWKVNFNERQRNWYWMETEMFLPFSLSVLTEWWHFVLCSALFKNFLLLIISYNIVCLKQVWSSVMITSDLAYGLDVPFTIGVSYEIGPEDIELSSDR